MGRARRGGGALPPPPKDTGPSGTDKRKTPSPPHPSCRHRKRRLGRPWRATCGRHPLGRDPNPRLVSLPLNRSLKAQSWEKGKPPPWAAPRRDCQAHCDSSSCRSEVVGKGLGRLATIPSGEAPGRGGAGLRFPCLSFSIWMPSMLWEMLGPGVWPQLCH